MKRFLQAFAGTVAGIILVGAVLIIVDSTIGQPVDPNRVCTDTGYSGAYNTENDDNPYTWRCFRSDHGDVAYPESELNIAAWCHSPVRVQNDSWECLPDWYPIRLSGVLPRVRGDFLTLYTAILKA